MPRCVGPNNEVQDFAVFCPKVFACIGGLTGALLSRCMVIHMEKAPSGHVRKSSRQRQLQRDSVRFREPLEAYAEQTRDSLIRCYGHEPDEGYWPQLRDREAELWGPLLTHARLIGSELESRLLNVALRFSAGKQQIEAQDRNVALTVELLGVLEGQTRPRFTAGDLSPLLVEKDGWGENLSGCRDERAKAAKVGRFLGRFRLSSREHTHRGTTYRLEEAISKLKAHVPECSVTSVMPVTEHLAASDCTGADSVTELTAPLKVSTKEVEL